MKHMRLSARMTKDEILALLSSVPTQPTFKFDKEFFNLAFPDLVQNVYLNWANHGLTSQKCSQAVIELCHEWHRTLWEETQMLEQRNGIAVRLVEEDGIKQDGILSLSAIAHDLYRQLGEIEEALGIDKDLAAEEEKRMEPISIAQMMNDVRCDLEHASKRFDRINREIRSIRGIM